MRSTSISARAGSTRSRRPTTGRTSSIRRQTFVRPIRIDVLRLCAAAGFAVALASCGGNAAMAPAALQPNATVHSSSNGKINHIVIVVQENRSFNNLFYGFPGARTATYGYTSTGQKVTLRPIGLETWWDVEHDSYGFFDACNGTGRI